VRGFVQHIGLHTDSALGGVLASLLDTLVQAGAPGYVEETARLDSLLGDEDFQSGFAPPSASPEGFMAADPVLDLEAQTERALAELQKSSPGLVQHADEVVGASFPGLPAPAGFVNPFEAARRGIRWVLLYGKHRLELTQILISAFQGRVNLYTPMSVDLGTALGDRASTTPREQMELQEKISRLSMLGRIPKGRDARVHPFVAFDPVRQAYAAAAKDLETPLDLVKTAVTKFGFVGVKVYPPMGWRPIGNTSDDDPRGKRLDEALITLYQWCQEEHVPITTHCNRSNYVSDGLADLSGPAGWVDVLHQFPNLHLDLGHFGGVHKEEDRAKNSPGTHWPDEIAAATADLGHLYVDVGNHPAYDHGLMEQYAGQLTAFFADPATSNVRDRIMFGSDWFMEALHPESDDFLSQYEDFFAKVRNSDQEGFLGGRALKFLGFGDSENRNNARLWNRYQQFAPARTPAWLVEPSAAAGAPTS
jgi:predicted TIM-barrel fold metal-dependent hydrolase